MQLFLDISRMCQRQGRSTPSGIDRVEYAFFSYSMRKLSTQNVNYILSSSLGRGVVRQERAATIYEQISNVWGLNRQPDSSTAYKSLVETLTSPLDLTRETVRRFSGDQQGRGWRAPSLPIPTRDLLRAGIRLNRALRAKAENRPGVYLHTSHAQLDRPEFFEWQAAANVRSVFFLHDIIPVDFPEFCRAGEDVKHRQRLETMARRGDLILVNSDYTGESARAYFKANQLPSPPIHTVPLAVDDAFRLDNITHQFAASHPYAVVLGTIEPRKNLTFLFTLWSRLVDMLGTKTPRLVLIGRRGWENEHVLDFLERSKRLAPYLVEVSDLSDAGVASVIRGARMLLSPSLVEGFNLPIAEALSLGIPVVASDIAAHREVGRGLARLIDPLDGPRWLEAISDLTVKDPVRRPDYRAWGWDDHVAQALAVIREHLNIG